MKIADDYYEIGYRDGESSRDADYYSVITEETEWPDNVEVTPEALAKYIKSLESRIGLATAILEMKDRRIDLIAAFEEVGVEEYMPPRQAWLVRDRDIAEITKILEKKRKGE
jgi:hypothetical protein